MRSKKSRDKVSLKEASIDELEDVSGGNWRCPSYADRVAMSSCHYQRWEQFRRQHRISACAERNIGWRNLARQYGV